MSAIPISQVSVLAVGIENYQFVPRLRGPRKDVENFTNLLVHSPVTGLYPIDQLKVLNDVDSNELRAAINEFIISRSAEGDILIFYFSGHGVPVGHSDFGFCTKDTRIHDATGSVLPLTLLTLRDLVESLRVMNVTPILLIDACYSGIAGHSLDISANDMVSVIRSSVANRNATNYAAYCACTDWQVAVGNRDGGIFSQAIFDVMSAGLNDKKSRRKPYLSIQDIHNQMQRRIYSLPLSSMPQLFLGETLPEFPLVKNSAYLPLEYRFAPYFKTILLTLWNNGEERELEIGEILTLVGRGAYGNHRKLSFGGWELVEDNPMTGKRRLTGRGRQFVRGELTIPYEITYNFESGFYEPAPYSHQITILMI